MHPTWRSCSGRGKSGDEFVVISARCIIPYCMKVWNALWKCIWAWLYDNDQREYIVSWAYLFGIWHCYMAMTIHDIRSWACLFGFWHGYMTMTITNIKYVTFSRSLARIRNVRNNVQYGAPYPSPRDFTKNMLDSYPNHLFPTWPILPAK